MTEQHLSKLDQIARDIYNFAANKLSNYFQEEYGSRQDASLEEQVEDFHLVAERASVYLMGNLLAIMDESVEEESIAVHNKHLRTMVRTIRSMTPSPKGPLN